MKEYTLKDKEIRWVLVCLGDFRHHTLDEIVKVYNSHHPPSILFPVGRSPQFIKTILNFLVHEGLVCAEVMSFYEEPIPATKFYTLTGAGIHFLNTGR
jgi:hypothetical protein